MLVLGGSRRRVEPMYWQSSLYAPMSIRLQQLSLEESLVAYDIIGDIHGEADKLRDLLAHLGYRETAGAFRHPERTAIFVGDLIDRGPRQRETVQTVRRMVASLTVGPGRG